MQLWTEYEGVTIDGAYFLQNLLLPEGRSAFYSAVDLNGESKVVRLIECHFDEEDILARWRSVQALNHSNFLKFEHYGQTEIDGRPVVYAVFEKVDTNLAEVLDRGTLSAEDVAQLGVSLVEALDELHTHGFVHEHVEPRNIFAVKDTVKLRSDCIREAPEGEERRAAKQRDVVDLVNVLLQALTQRASVQGLPDSLMPAPFHQIIHNGLDGSWGLGEIRTALKASSASKQPVTATLKGAEPSPTGETRQKTLIAAAATPGTQLPLIGKELHRVHVRSNIPGEARTKSKGLLFSPKTLGVLGVVVVLILGFLWAHGRGGSTNQLEAARGASMSKSAVHESAQPSVQTSQQSSNALPRPSSATRIDIPAAATGHGAGWRVIAFTYNRKQDAEKKVASIAHRHPGLSTAVFTPSGHSPYLVSIGGVMEERAAHALARRARSLGLPHDTYAQNYTR